MVEGSLKTNGCGEKEMSGGVHVKICGCGSVVEEGGVVWCGVEERDCGGGCWVLRWYSVVVGLWL